jgi:peptidoglycan/xylan/chitin deacetylase (PgdA/CDA1 family)
LLTALLFAATLAIANCNCVAFRLDDVQDYYNRDGQIAAIQLFHDNNETLTIGVIGEALGQDKGLVQFLQENQNVVEFANHGWRHEDFSALSTEEQTRLINQANAKMTELLGVKPVTFIAPFNLMNNGTSEAASQNGMTVISADEKADHPRIDDVWKMYHLPVNANVSDFDNVKTYWKDFDNKIVMSDAMKGLKRDGYAMIMVHPRDLVDKDHKVDLVKLNHLKELINSFRSQGVRIVTVKELAGIATSTSAPPTQITTESSLTVIVGVIATAVSLLVWARSRI